MGEKICHGDMIVLLESSGIHANGLTLARKIAQKWATPDNPFAGYLKVLPTGRTYGEALLDPTHIYVGFVEDCLNDGIDIHYAVNVTGHGWRKFMRATQPFTYVIDKLPEQHSVLDFIQEHGPVEVAERCLVTTIWAQASPCMCRRGMLGKCSNSVENLITTSMLFSLATSRRAKNES